MREVWDTQAELVRVFLMMRFGWDRNESGMNVGLGNGVRMNQVGQV